MALKIKEEINPDVILFEYLTLEDFLTGHL